MAAKHLKLKERRGKGDCSKPGGEVGVWLVWMGVVGLL